jgi:hypothetical protein
LWEVTALDRPVRPAKNFGACAIVLLNSFDVGKNQPPSRHSRPNEFAPIGRSVDGQLVTTFCRIGLPLAVASLSADKPLHVSCRFPNMPKHAQLLDFSATLKSTAAVK